MTFPWHLKSVVKGGGGKKKKIFRQEKPDCSHPLGPQKTLKERLSEKGNMNFFHIKIFVEIVENLS